MDRLVGCCVRIHGRWGHWRVLRSDTREMGNAQDVVLGDLNDAQVRDSVTWTLRFVSVRTRGNLILYRSSRVGRITLDIVSVMGVTQFVRLALKSRILARRAGGGRETKSISYIFGPRSDRLSVQRLNR